MTGRIALMLAGIAVMALGIDVVVKADLGNSPISATPNVLALGFPAVSFGTFMLGWQCFRQPGARVCQTDRSRNRSARVPWISPWSESRSPD